MSRSVSSSGPRGLAAAAWVWRVAPWGLAAVVVALLAYEARSVDWSAVGVALRQVRAPTLAAAAALALLSHALFSSFDLVGRHQTGHRVPLLRTLGIAAVCYAFNLNFGSLVGAFAVKLRLYARAGVKPERVAHIIALSLVTNWIGYLLLAGTILLVAPPPWPAWIEWPDAGARALGALLLAAVALYGLWCARRRGRPYRWRRLHFAPPGWPVALWQLAVAAANWALMALIAWLLFERTLPYASVAGVLLLAAVAGVVTHVPAGLGVLEAVFLSCLGSAMPPPAVLAALLCYRAVYYLAPLALASAGYAWMEWSARASRRR
ncbi:MAG TPA: lysylphosphatidylglycerol synthase domain-containing protein [Burkholderiaceae bacterium]|nr:lysylphosphatidylglycerol synthase domain-containing protein [Burkholderiaceae bacterium]